MTAVKKLISKDYICISALFLIQFAFNLFEKRAMLILISVFLFFYFVFRKPGNFAPVYCFLTVTFTHIVMREVDNSDNLLILLILIYFPIIKNRMETPKKQDKAAILILLSGQIFYMILKHRIMFERFSFQYLFLNGFAFLFVFLFFTAVCVCCVILLRNAVLNVKKKDTPYFEALSRSKKYLTDITLYTALTAALLFAINMFRYSKIIVLQFPAAIIYSIIMINIIAKQYDTMHKLIKKNAFFVCIFKFCRKTSGKINRFAGFAEKYYDLSTGKLKKFLFE